MPPTALVAAEASTMRSIDSNCVSSSELRRARRRVIAAAAVVDVVVVVIVVVVVVVVGFVIAGIRCRDTSSRTADRASKLQRLLLQCRAAGRPRAMLPSANRCFWYTCSTIAPALKTPDLSLRLNLMTVPLRVDSRFAL